MKRPHVYAAVFTAAAAAIWIAEALWLRRALDLEQDARREAEPSGDTEADPRFAAGRRGA